jgi:hypothetical protein
MAISYSPDVMVEAKIFIPDHDKTLCATSSNRFFEITDRQVAAIANSEAVIAGQRVRVRKYMVFNDDWVERNFNVPLSGVGEVVAAYAENTVAPSSGSTPWYGRSSYQSPSDIEKRGSKPFFAVTLVTILVLTGFACAFAHPWMPSHAGPLGFFVFVLALSAAHPQVQYFMQGRGVRTTLYIAGPVFGAVLIALIVVFASATKEKYLEELHKALRADSTGELGRKFEDRYHCSSANLPNRDPSYSCWDSLEGDIRFFCGAIRVVVVIFLLLQPVIVGMALCFQRSWYQDEETP